MRAYKALICPPIFLFWPATYLVNHQFFQIDGDSSMDQAMRSAIASRTKELTVISLFFASSTRASIPIILSFYRLLAQQSAFRFELRSIRYGLIPRIVRVFCREIAWFTIQAINAGTARIHVIWIKLRAIAANQTNTTIEHTV